MTESTQATELQAALQELPFGDSYAWFMAHFMYLALNPASQALTLNATPKIHNVWYREFEQARALTMISGGKEVCHLQNNFIPRNASQIGIWYGSETRQDQAGRNWSRRVEMVQDDFGNLVEVAA